MSGASAAASGAMGAFAQHLSRTAFRSGRPIVRGHCALMLSCTQEDIPAGTWNPHEAVWGYNAQFVAEVYLWLGMRDLARRTFAGFLNHASPLYCWREEQPLREGLNGTYVGDMPHNWASAECIRFLRHILALEDGDNLRLLTGVLAEDLTFGQPIRLTQSPTRFGRVSLDLEPLDRGRGWRLVSTVAAQDHRQHAWNCRRSWVILRPPE